MNNANLLNKNEAIELRVELNRLISPQIAIDNKPIMAIVVDKYHGINCLYGIVIEVIHGDDDFDLGAHINSMTFGDVTAARSVYRDMKKGGEA